MFVQVLGTPTKKPEHLANILQKEHCSPQELVMVGDGLNDLVAAEVVGCWFVGVRTPQNEREWRDASFPMVDHICELPAVLGLA